MQGKQLPPHASKRALVRVASGRNPNELRCQNPDCVAVLDVTTIPPEAVDVILPRIFRSAADAAAGSGGALPSPLSPSVLELFRECERQGDGVSFAVLMAELAAGVLEAGGAREPPASLCHALSCSWPYCDSCYVALKASRLALYKDACARRDEVLVYLDRLEGSSSVSSGSASSRSGAKGSEGSEEAGAGGSAEGDGGQAAAAAAAAAAATENAAGSVDAAVAAAAVAAAVVAAAAAPAQEVSLLPLPPLQQLTEALDAEEAALRSALAAAEGARAAAAARAARVRARRAALLALQRGLWTTHREVAARLRAGREAMDALQVQCARHREALARLRCLRVHSDAFFIWHAEPYATINGARLGRVPGRGSSVPDWAEVNAALGQMALLLSLTAARLHYVFKKWRIIPMGSYSKIALVEDERASRQELSYDTGAFFPAARLSSALKPLMLCMAELGAHCEVLEMERQGGGGGGGARQDFLPHPISPGGERVGELAVALGKDVPWTRAMRMAATNLKWLCAYAEKLER